jgi:membrane protease subunit HflC
MKRIFLFAAGIVLIAIFVLYMISFQVNFDESAIITTFGKASKKDVINAQGNDAGLHFKWPWPIQKVKKFDRRLLVLDDRLEQQETKDKQVVILKTYAAWKIVEPLNFYRSLKNIKGGERFLRERLRSARSEIGNFTFDDLTNVDPEKLKIVNAENAILKRMRSDLLNLNCGIAIESLGISRIILPEQITSSVFSRMKRTRQRLAQNARSEGNAIARSIRAKADSDKRRIMAFAEREAQGIRAEGDAAAAKYYKVFAQNEKFAIFLRKLEALESVLSNNTTFLLDTKMAPFDLLNDLSGPVKINTSTKTDNEK